jgi:cell division protein FtsB
MMGALKREFRVTLLQSLKRQLRGAIPPAIFLALAGYFAWNASRGDLGLHAYARREQDLQSAQATLAQTDAERAAWERRVRALRPGWLDADLLDEQARMMLNLAEPDDIVVPYGPAGRLY